MHSQRTLHTSSLFVCVVLSSCQDFQISPETTGGQTWAEDCAGVLKVSPSSLDFGSLSVLAGESAWQDLTLTNNSNCLLTLSDVSISGDEWGAYHLEGPTTPALAERQSALLRVTFTPNADATHTAEIRIDSSDPAKPTTAVAASGDGIAPKINIEPKNHDFGNDFVGCDTSLPISIQNIGREDLTIYETSFTAFSPDLSFQFSLDGELETGSWTLAPGDEHVAVVSFTPTQQGDASSALNVSSNDPQRPLERAEQTARADFFAWNTDVFEQPLQPQTDIIFAVDVSGSMNDNNEKLEDNFEVFANMLRSLKSDFRIAAVIKDNWQVIGGIPYINNDNADDASLILSAMIDGEPDQEYVDLPYNQLEAALAANKSWFRTNAELHLVGITDTLGGTTSDEPSEYVSIYQSYKKDPDMVTVHGIGGPLPDGCDNKAWPMLFFYEAIELTGGLFQSICSDDWSPMLSALAEAAVPDLLSFELSADPVADTIEVTVDGMFSSHWSYDAASNAIFFEEDNKPEGGSIVTVEYAVVPDTCD